MSSLNNVQDLLSLAQQWCRENVKADNLEDAEEVCQQVGRLVAGAMAQECISALDEKDFKAPSRIACDCGKRAEYKHTRQRTIVTLCGEVRVWRAYYYCPHCSTGITPWDRRQGLDQQQWTPHVKALVGELAGCVTYQQAVGLLQQLCGLKVRVRSAEQIAQQVGDGLRERQAALAKAVMAGETLPFVGPVTARFYIGMDAGKACIDEQWRDVKVLAQWTSKPDRDGIDSCERTWYAAAVETAEDFGARAYAQAVQCGAEQAREQIVIGDGADWIWNLADHHWPHATQIVDYYHACEHVHDLAKAHYGENSEPGKRWAREQCKKLKERGPDSLLRALRRMPPRDEADAETIRLQRHYFTNHRKRMRYGQFRARGLMIGSGPVEAACKSVIGTRLKRPGMRWSYRGADAVLALRCAVLNDQRHQIAEAARLAA